MPILWHIMKEYFYYEFHDFIICAGYRQHIIKEWFPDYYFHTCDVDFGLTHGNQIIIYDQKTEPWRVAVVGMDYSYEKRFLESIIQNKNVSWIKWSED